MARMEMEVTAKMTSNRKVWKLAALTPNELVYKGRRIMMMVDFCLD